MSRIYKCDICSNTNDSPGREPKDEWVSIFIVNGPVDRAIRFDHPLHICPRCRSRKEVTPEYLFSRLWKKNSGGDQDQ